MTKAEIEKRIEELERIRECPLCHEQGFDLWGVALHYNLDRCNVYNALSEADRRAADELVADAINDEQLLHLRIKVMPRKEILERIEWIESGKWVRFASELTLLRQQLAELVNNQLLGE